MKKWTYLWPLFCILFSFSCLADLTKEEVIKWFPQEIRGIEISDETKVLLADAVIDHFKQYTSQSAPENWGTRLLFFKSSGKSSGKSSWDFADSLPFFFTAVS